MGENINDVLKLDAVLIKLNNEMDEMLQFLENVSAVIGSASLFFFIALIVFRFEVITYYYYCLASGAIIGIMMSE
jgi:hypothetical protein